ncbi:MAG: D-sedoheptulose 7-phosphate isomerase [Candidatus Omnitrophota bacterium]
MREKIKRLIEESRDAKRSLLSEECLRSIEKSATRLVEALKSGHKVLVFGNGGSAADSQHMVGELVGRFKKERRALPAVALTTNTSTLTALANDYEYSICFKRQVEALGQKGDVAVGLSTSGRSVNVIEALKEAHRIGMGTIAFAGNGGAGIRDIADVTIAVASGDTPRVQEAHILVIHIICELIEEAF